MSLEGEMLREDWEAIQERYPLAIIKRIKLDGAAKHEVWDSEGGRKLGQGPTPARAILDAFRKVVREDKRLAKTLEFA